MATPRPRALLHNLPAELTSFIGREREIAQVKGFVSRTRLLTLIGAGGAGKSRLAFRVATDERREIWDDVWIVELASLVDPALVPQRVAGALGVPEQPGRVVADTLVEALRSKSVLLVLDNCEQVLEACARLISELLHGCPNLRALATSRLPLGVAGETLWRVPSLSLPDAGRPLSVDEIGQSEAVRLFIERAQDGVPTFTVTPDNALWLVRLCHRLDGMPLAIELAAARTRVLSIEQIVARLDDRFRLLTGGAATALPRHQTLLATMDWSYSLLADRERMLLRRLSVFAGGWTLEAAEAVCGGDGLDAGDVLDSSGRLVDNSLVIAETQHGAARYRSLETVGEYARDKLHEADEDTSVRRRHRDWYLAMAEQAVSELGGPRQAVWFERLEREHDNLRAALEWCHAEKDEAGAALRLTDALRGFWARRGHWREGRKWLEAALARSAEVPPSALIGILLGATHFARRRGDYGLAMTLGQKGLALCEELGNRQGSASFLSALGIVTLLQQDYEQAARFCAEALTLSREQGNKSLMGTVLDTLATVARYQGDYERAATLYGESLALFREISDEWNIALALWGLAVVALLQSDYERSSALFTDSLTACKEAGNTWISEECLEGFARVASATGHYVRAACLFGAAGALRETLDHRRSRADQTYHDERVASTRAALGDAPFEAAREAGRAMTLVQAVDYALAGTVGTPLRATAAGPAAEGKPGLLTAREQEVAVLVAQGLTNREIASSLVVTERTAETHVQNILNKLGFSSRAQVAAWAVEQGLKKPSARQ